MKHVRMDSFIFDEADYQMIAQKELQEVGSIFEAFGLKIKSLNDQQIDDSDNEEVCDAPSYRQPESVPI